MAAAAAHDDSQYGYSHLSIRLIPPKFTLHDNQHCIQEFTRRQENSKIMYAIWVYSLVLAVVCRSAEMPITSRASRPLTDSDGPIVVDVPCSGTIGDLRGRLRAAARLPTRGVVTMSHGDTTLGDDAVLLADAGICAESEVQFDYAPSVLIQIRLDVGQPWEDVEVTGDSFERLMDGLTQKAKHLVQDGATIEFVYDQISVGENPQFFDEEVLIMVLLERLRLWKFIVTEDDIRTWLASRAECGSCPFRNVYYHIKDP